MGGEDSRVAHTGLTVGRTRRLKAAPWRSAQPVRRSCGGTSVARSALSCSTSRVSRFCVPGIKPLHRLALEPSHEVCSVSHTTKSTVGGSAGWRARCMLARANSASAPRSVVTPTRIDGKASRSLILLGANHETFARQRLLLCTSGSWSCWWVIPFCAGLTQLRPARERCTRRCTAPNLPAALTGRTTQSNRHPFAQASLRAPRPGSRLHNGRAAQSEQPPTSQADGFGPGQFAPNRACLWWP